MNTTPWRVQSSRTRSKAAVLAFEFLTVALRDNKLRQAMVDELSQIGDNETLTGWAAAQKDLVASSR